MKKSEISAPVEEGAGEPLLDADAIKPGSVKKVKNGAYGSSVWTLSNGAKVVFMPTTLKNDEVIISVVKNGGSTLIETSELPSFEDNAWMLFQQNRGLSKFSGVQLKKMLTGKNVKCALNIGNTSHDITATATPKDIETAMQLIYLNVADPRFDNEEYQNGINQIKAILPNLEKQPMMQFQKHANAILYGNHERRQVVSTEMLEKMNITDLENASRRLFGDVAGATVYIVGNIDAETLKPLVEKYIASLPGGKKGAKVIDRKENIVKGEVVSDLPIAMETPKNTVLQVYSAKIPYSIQNDVLLEVASLYLDMIYVETLRESEGGTYGASTAAQMRREPKPLALIQVAFETNPESVKKLSDLAVAGIYSLVEDGIPADKLDMILQNIKKNIPQKRVSNSYWMNCLKSMNDYEEDYDALYESAVNSVTSEAVQELMQTIVNQHNFIQVSISPAE